MMTGLVLFSVSVSKVLAENTTCSLAGIRNGHGGQKTSSAVFIGMKMVGERMACAVLWKWTWREKGSPAVLQERTHWQKYDLLFCRNEQRTWRRKALPALLQELGLDMEAGDHRMTAERCAHLSAVAIANQLDEAWISLQPELSYLYLNQYLPAIARWWVLFNSEV